MLTEGELVTVIAGVNRAVVHCVARKKQSVTPPLVLWGAWVAPETPAAMQMVRSILLLDEGVTWERGHMDGASLRAANLLAST